MNITMFIEYSAFMSLLILSIVLTLRVRKDDDESVGEDHEQFNSTLEKKLYDGLLSYGLRPSLHYQVGKYSIDIAFPSVKIAVEAIEQDFLNSSYEMDDEWEKEVYLKNHGWTVLRFSGARIDEDLSRVVEKISRELTNKSNSS
ncbi:DUF559 domain-containing protein [Halobacillus litoralis]|uniref:DUF559 domain-containing protein n=1 Tax=Halobacillus litoralis TaxID=45668 RepID=UPI002492530D|nr:DUF559 domain-containing protein [Halobacillus litoralis]